MPQQTESIEGHQTQAGTFVHELGYFLMANRKAVALSWGNMVRSFSSLEFGGSPARDDTEPLQRMCLGISRVHYVMVELFFICFGIDQVQFHCYTGKS